MERLHSCVGLRAWPRRGMQTVTLIVAASTCGALPHRVLHAVLRRRSAPKSQEPLGSSRARGAARRQKQCGAVVCCGRRQAVVVRGVRSREGVGVACGSGARQRAPPRAPHAPHSVHGDDGGYARAPLRADIRKLARSPRRALRRTAARGTPVCRRELAQRDEFEPRVVPGTTRRPLCGGHGLQGPCRSGP